MGAGRGDEHALHLIKHGDLVELNSVWCSIFTDGDYMRLGNELKRKGGHLIVSESKS